MTGARSAPCGSPAPGAPSITAATTPSHRRRRGRSNMFYSNKGVTRAGRFSEPMSIISRSGNLSAWARKSRKASVSVMPSLAEPSMSRSSKKAPERPRGMGDLDFEIPQTRRRALREVAQGPGPIDGVWKVADAMTADFEVQTPSHRRRLFGGVGVERLAGGTLVRPTRGHDRPEVAGGLGASAHVRIGAGDEGVAGVPLVTIPDDPPGRQRRRRSRRATRSGSEGS